MVELCGKRVILRTLEREHCQDLWQSFEPVEPLPTEPLRPGLSVEGAGPWFEEMQARQGKDQLYLGIWTQNRLIGDIQLSQLDWRNRTASLGFGISRHKDRAQGYGTDAVRTMLAFAFEHLDLVRVSATTVEHNTASQRLLSKCGFVLEGRERQAIRIAGRRWDRLIFGLLRQEFVCPESTET